MVSTSIAAPVHCPLATAHWPTTTRADRDASAPDRRDVAAHKSRSIRGRRRNASHFDAAVGPLQSAHRHDFAEAGGDVGLKRQHLAHDRDRSARLRRDGTDQRRLDVDGLGLEPAATAHSRQHHRHAAGKLFRRHGDAIDGDRSRGVVVDLKSVHADAAESGDRSHDSGAAKTAIAACGVCAEAGSAHAAIGIRLFGDRCNHGRFGGARKARIGLNRLRTGRTGGNSQDQGC
jgi:hypothetical protein